ncbi:hypothetical protein ABZ281_10825 [Streptomyces sp. NPDC006265]|uniref:hypothetical protein n=1 Tax=Streptomyces sp. NPDC006265 TaxID=3156740 RepID=UPI0033A04AFE
MIADIHPDEPLNDLHTTVRAAIQTVCGSNATGYPTKVPYVPAVSGERPGGDLEAVVGVVALALGDHLTLDDACRPMDADLQSYAKCRQLSHRVRPVQTCW